METKELNLRITLDRRSVFLLLVLFFVSWHPGPIGSETLTLTTYYPAPYGGYVSLLTTGNTILARDNGTNVVIGSGAAVDKLTVRAAGTAITAVDGTVNTRFFSAASTGFGYAGTSSNHGFRLRTADLDRMTITNGGEVQVVNNLRVSGSIVGSCVLRRYLPTSGQTFCTSLGADYRLIGFYPDGVKRVVGFLPTSNTTSNVGTYISLGEDWGGNLLCCRVEIN